ncbi:TPA: hypothetical protein ACIX5J_004950 [Escherichia coli]|jgi:hypothetical protein|uniref:hypothetical protein n=1 Tax=Enterobacter asburiae TaxID=61645 RepID=UPI00002763F9|nr:hypothetical protein [Enterobacter asburiae]MEB2411815.1 hypothetical protein [Enterobacter asburiae]HBL0735532.1 hypothetical protein [Kluyvera ascorbata]
MSRDIKLDFDELVGFFSNYSLKDVFKDKTLLAKVSLIHKRYYSFMCLVYCLQHLPSENMDNNAMLRLKESSSDLGTSMFLIINGAYKPANLMMRSCIENFIKSIGCLIDVSILEEKSVFKVIDTAGKHPVVVTNYSFYETLKAEYSSLCSHVHTATEKEMTQMKALNAFPTVDQNKVAPLSNSIDKIVKSMIYITISLYSNIFFSFASEYREKVLVSLTAAQKASLHLPE